MNTQRLKMPVVTLLPAFVAFLIMQACGGSDSAIAQDAADPFEGVWESVVTQRDCTTSAAVGTFLGAQVYHRGGTLGDTNASPTATRGPGFGTWVKNGSTYSTKFRFYVYDASGAVSGVTRASGTVTLGADAKTSTTTVSNQLFDLNGNVLRSGCATAVSTRAP